MRRAILLLLAAGAVAPLAPANASVYCGEFGPIRNAFGPVCALKCTYENPPVVDPSRVPPAYLPDASCYYED